MGDRLSEIWVYLAASPLLGLTVTLLAYQAAHWIYLRANTSPFANPVALSIAFLVALLWFTDTPYATYFDGAQFVHFLLGPATVALAVPLYANLARLKRELLPIIGALVAGALTAAVSAMVRPARKRSSTTRAWRSFSAARSVSAASSSSTSSSSVAISV